MGVYDGDVFADTAEKALLRASKLGPIQPWKIHTAATARFEGGGCL